MQLPGPLEKRWENRTELHQARGQQEGVEARARRDEFQDQAPQVQGWEESISHIGLLPCTLSFALKGRSRFRLQTSFML